MVGVIDQDEYQVFMCSRLDGFSMYLIDDSDLLKLKLVLKKVL